MPDLHEKVSLPNGPVSLEASVHWRRSARARRVSLRIDAASGAVIVTLPPRTAQSAGRALLLNHAGWILDRLSRLPPPVLLADGGAIPLHGTPHRIRHRPGARGTAWIEQGELHVAGDPAFLPRRVTDFLRLEARRTLGAQAAKIAIEAGLVPRRIVVKDTRTRWGSCTADGTLMFCWRLVMAPPDIQHYVVAHEVAHLRHMDHGPAFWSLVRRLTPHRIAATAWLAAEGPGLQRVG